MFNCTYAFLCVNIKLSGDDDCYCEVANYVCKKDTFTFTVFENSGVKNITVPKNRIEYIERVLDPKENMLGRNDADIIEKQEMAKRTTSNY